MLSRIIPSLPTQFEHKTGEQIFLTGYPGEKLGLLYQMRSTIFDGIKTEGDTELLVFKDIKYSGGLNGSPICIIDEDKTELIGIYIGYDESGDVNIASSITREIKIWLKDLMSENLLIQDLEIRLLPPLKYSKPNTAKIQQLLSDLKSGPPLTPKSTLTINANKNSDLDFINAVNIYQ